MVLQALRKSIENYIRADKIGERVAKRGKLPKWAIKQAGGINKKAWRLARRGRKSSSRRRATGAVKRRRNPPKRRTMKKKIVSVNLVELGGGLVIADQILGPTGVKNLLSGDVGAVLTGTASRLRDKTTQNDLIKTGVGVMIIKAAAQSLGQRRIGKIGPLVMRV